MATSKAALKSIKASIDAGDFAKAATQARELTSQDGQNYNAFMFLGFAEEKLGHLGEAEKALQTALTLKGHDVQAFKGLITLYEKQGAGKLDDYHDVVTQLATIYAQQEDANQCQNVVDKYELFAKKHGSRLQYRRALQLMLPSSQIYATLEGRVPHPSHTYQRILESCQSEEKEWMSNEITNRRTRLGAKLDRVTQEVRSEAIQRFQIEENYQNLIDWTQDDEMRHMLDEELFQRMVENLRGLPPDMKPIQRDKVLEKANGMVIIQQRFLDAWQIALEWVDAEDITDWDVTILRQYIEFFPDDGLAKVLRGFLDGNKSPFVEATDRKTGGGKDDEGKLSEADQLIIMNEGLEDCPSSMLAFRVMAHTYLELDEQFSAMEMARKSLKLYLAAQKDFALEIQDSLDAVDLILGRALIVYQSPRHHPEARMLFEKILKRKPLLTSALLGVGLVLEEDEDYTEAGKFFARALERDSSNVRIRLEYAWCLALAHDLAAGLVDLEAVLDIIEQEKAPRPQMKAETLYRIAYCKWHLNSSFKARKDKAGPYKYLIAALKANPTYAPAYSLLGIYFQDYAKNRQRARVALQKAFELSSSELVAAERLAKTFADTAEWELVELVAQRVVESGKARPAPGSKKKAYSWPYAALGVVQMNRSQYSQSIVSYQHALRISPGDYHSWIGLGESYHNSGRYVAASRAFYRAESIDHGLPADQSWFAKYMLANVQRELGAFEEAIRGYEEVLELKQAEFGVQLSLLQTLVDSAWTRMTQGHFGEASSLAIKAVAVAKDVADQRSDVFNLWKSLGDACSVLGSCKAFAPRAELKVIEELLRVGEFSGAFDLLATTDKVALPLNHDTNTASDCADEYLLASILSHKRAVHASAHDIHAQAISWYNLGWAENAAYVSASSTLHIRNRKPRDFLKAAVRCFKRAIELEASNADFWNALGVATSTLSPKVAQHAFVRSLHLNDYSARTWTNLAVLYLLNNETELANEAFTRAQSSDPEYAPAWIGQAFLASLYGNLKEARGLFKHAFEIADSSSIPAKRHYATSVFDQLVGDIGLSEEIGNILQPLFALQQLHVQRPNEIITSHVLSLFAERVDEFRLATQSLEQVCGSAEAEYENSESNEALVKFAQAKADLARQQLGQKHFREAIENAQFALDLSEDNLGPAYERQRCTWRLGAHLTAGLARSHLKNMQESIEMFQAALEDSKAEDGRTNPDIVCMLAQALWAHGGEQEREAARSQLFECVEEHENHVGAVALLAVVMLIDGDEEGLEVAEEDLRTLRTASQVSVLAKLKIAKVLAAILFTRKRSDNTENMAITDALSSVMLNPAQPQGWLELAELSNSQYASEMALNSALRQIPPHGNLMSIDLAKTYIETGDVEHFKQGIMLAPALKMT